MLPKNGKGSDPKTTMLIVLVGVLIGGVAIYFATTFLPEDNEEEMTQAPPSGQAPSTPNQTHQPPSEKSSQPPSSEQSQPPTPEESSLVLTSSAFEQNGALPKAYTCESKKNHIPPLKIEKAPANSHTFALLFTKKSNSKLLWGIYDIPSDKKVLEGDKFIQEAKMISTDFGNSYVGPCPSQTQEYVFTLYALDDKADLPTDHPISQEKLLKAMQGHIIAKTTLEASFSPSKPHEGYSVED